jgi:hypothetical protein
MMHPKYFFIALMILSGITGAAQFKKGNRMIGATIGSGYFSSGKTVYAYPAPTTGYISFNHSWNLGFTPAFGWFVKDNAIAGVHVIANTSHQKTWNESSGITNREDNLHNTDFGGGIFYRYYFSTTAKANPFLHAYFIGGSGITKTNGFYYTTGLETYNGKSSNKFFYNLGLRAGLTRMISSSAGLEASVGYIHSFTRFTTKTKAILHSSGGNIISEYQPTQKFTGNGINLDVGLEIFLH